MQPISEQAESGVVNCVTVERLEAEDTKARHTYSSGPAGVVKEAGLSPLADEASGGNVSLGVNSSPENNVHSQPTADHVEVIVSSNPSDLM